MTEARKPVRKPRTPDVTQPAAKPAPAKRKTAVRKKAADALPRTTQPSPEDDRVERVRLAAYLRAEHRGFVSGHELEDWLAAEAQVNAVTGSAHGAREATSQRGRVKARKT